MSSAPALTKPEKGDVLSLYLAVSSTAVSAVLVKDHEGTQYPIYYVIKVYLMPNPGTHTSKNLSLH
uniref:Uncharacterized protein n=1 Tax=Helianthus annuus TaxID=4232 RepID=A0A251SF40_HELAN